MNIITKKLAAALAALSIAVSVSACGQSEKSADDSGSTATSDPLAAAREAASSKLDEIEARTSGETAPGAESAAVMTESSNVEEETNKGPVEVRINLHSDVNNFSNDVCLYNTRKYTVAAVDINGNILFEIDTDRDDTKKRICHNDTYLIADSLYDRNGNVIISSEKQGFDKLILSTDQYFWVYKKESGFDGDKYYYGVLDTGGSWVKPLSTDVPICDYGLGEYVREVKSDSGIYARIKLVTSGWNNKYIFYDCMNDRVIYESEGNHNIDYAEIKDEQLIIGFGDVNYTIRLCNINTKEEKDTLEYKYQRVFYDDALYKPDDKSGIYNFEGSLLIDLSEYNIVEGYDYAENTKQYICKYVNGNAVFVAKGKDSGVYLCCVNSNGEKKFDPIERHQSGNTWDGFLAVYDDKIICYDNNSEYFSIIDINGNVTDTPIDERLAAYDASTGIYQTGKKSYDIYEDVTVYNSDNEPILIID